MSPSELHENDQRNPPDAALHSDTAPVSALPTGDVTFLYTDIEGSTERWERAPTAMRQALIRHHAILRAAINEHGGVVYQIIGDAFVAVFVAAPAALHAALHAQRTLFAEPWDAAVVPLRVRMALHHGQGRYQNDGYHAEESLNRLFRLLSASYGGQIVLTNDVHALIDSAWPRDVQARDLGLHRLRDLTTRLHVWQVIAPDLPADFPPLRSLSHHPNNLPSQTTELYGRAEEIARVAARMRESQTRQLTLTGLGGIGKTRLGLAVAAELLPDFPDGVYFVALDQVQEAAQVATLLASTLGVRDEGEQPLPELLAQWLQPKRLLLLVDNCEHVLAAASLVIDLLRAAPNLKVLATSQVPVGVYGEQEHAVPPLPIPSADTTADLATLEQNAAVTLFVARAQAVAPGFRLNTTNAAAVTEICMRLEGLPLAIELAAARVRALPPVQILARLGDRLDFLQAQSRDGPRRQQTLRATLEWSYALLPLQEQKLLAWLSVFVGGASLEAVMAVWQPDNMQPLDAVDGLITLVSHSLVQAQTDDEMPRYLLLDTVREYGHEQLAARGEFATATLRHATYFEQLAATYSPGVLNNSTAKAAVKRDYPNLRAALQHVLEQQHVELALRISRYLMMFWWSSGLVREGWELVQATLALPMPRDTPDELMLQRAWTGLKSVLLAESLGEHAESRKLVEDALGAARMLEDDRLLAEALQELSNFLDWEADYDQMLALLNEALTLNQRLESTNGEAATYIKLGLVEYGRQSYIAAQKHCEAALALFHEGNNRRGMLAALTNLGTIAAERQDNATAERFYQDALTISYELDNQPKIVQSLLSLGHLALTRLDLSAARAYLSEALHRADQGEFKAFTVFIIGFIGWLAEIEEQMEQAASLLGVYDVRSRAHQVGHDVLTGYEQAPLVAARERVRAQLGEEAFSHHYAAGQQLSLPEAIAAAREFVALPGT